MTATTGLLRSARNDSNTQTKRKDNNNYRLLRSARNDSNTRIKRKDNNNYRLLRSARNDGNTANLKFLTY